MKQLIKQRYQAMHGEEREGGFTLIELLVVIVILAILAAVVVFAVGGITDKGQTSACKADRNTIQTAQEAYYANQTGVTASYASNAQALVDAGFLAELPTLHTTTGSGNSYTIATTSEGGCTT